MYSYRGYAGCIVIRKVRTTGTEVGLYYAPDADIDTTPGYPWVTLCEEHGYLLEHRTRSIASSYLPYPIEWCDSCYDKHGS